MWMAAGRILHAAICAGIIQWGVALDAGRAKRDHGRRLRAFSLGSRDRRTRKYPMETTMTLASTRSMPALCLALLAALPAGRACAAEWSDTALSWRIGNKFREPFNPNDIR